MTINRSINLIMSLLEKFKSNIEKLIIFFFLRDQSIDRSIKRQREIKSQSN